MSYILLQAAGGSTGGGAQFQILFFIAIFAIMYFLMIRPQQKRQKETQKMLDSLQVNDKVVTAAGIIGRVVSIKPDKNIVVIEIDDTNKVRVDFQRSAVVAIINPTQEVK
jgi:preprotein translocase subunit YajC